MDGAVDQTFAFNRTSFVQLTAAKIEQVDKLGDSVPDATIFLLENLQTITGKINQSVSVLLSD